MCLHFAGLPDGRSGQISELDASCATDHDGIADARAAGVDEVLDVRMDGEPPVLSATEYVHSEPTRTLTRQVR